LPTALDQTKLPAPVWRRNSDKQDGPKPARLSAAGTVGKRGTTLSSPNPFNRSSLCNLCVLCVSVVRFAANSVNHRDTENTEVAQRRAPPQSL